MKITIIIEWHTKVRPVRRHELMNAGIEEAQYMLNKGHNEGPLTYTDGKDRLYTGYWKRKIEVE